VLTGSESSEPGLWRNERTPYLAGIMDAVCDPTAQEVSFLKPTQVGGSEALRNIIGYWIEEDPGPCLIVMPSESSVKELLEERLKPLILNSPNLRRHWSGDPHDMTHSAVRLDSMSIFFGWAGSPQSLASRPCRYVVFDEIDKYPPFAGREADPISLGIERTATYGHRRKILKISTPTTRNGPIFRAWENSGDRRHFHVPCPHCGEYQELIWQRVKWPRLDIADPNKRADAIEQGRLAYYECGHCKKRIDDHHKPKMLQAGRWVRDDGCDLSKRVAFQLDAIYSPWRSLSSEAAEDIRAGSDPGARMNVTNSRRAQPFDNLVSKTAANVIREKSDRGPAAGIVPAWAVAVFATVDTQKDWFKVHIGAWGAGYRYQLLQETVVAVRAARRRATCSSTRAATEHRRCTSSRYATPAASCRARAHRTR
jgi:phage terminase large subunit GpA-like protein